MADWFWPALPSTGKPVTAEWGAAVQENPVAIAEGALGAPRVVSKGLGRLSLAAALITDATPLEIVGLDAVSSLHISSSNRSATPTLQISFSTDSGSSWGAWQTLVQAYVGVGEFRINLETGAYINRVVALSTGVVGSGIAITAPASITGVRFRLSASSAQGADVFVTYLGRASV